MSTTGESQLRTKHGLGRGPDQFLPEWESAPHESVGAMSRMQVLRWWALSLLWLAITGTFWAWWLAQAGTATPGLFWPQTVALLYHTTLLPSFFWFYVRRMRRPVEPPAPAPADVRVAMIAPCVPAQESPAVIRRQLEALTAVTYPHDSWILDEGGSPAVAALAAEYGVGYFTRHDVPEWNQPGPPFQRRTKAGNVNAWLDHAGEDYDVFVQLDIDHRPRPDYLDRVLGYLRDPTVAWVQAPSVSDNHDAWTARGLSEQDLVFQGPLQMGFYGRTRTPFIIGSHTTYRTSAVREIGGFQPTRAEDHLDTVVLAAHGYKGVFVPDTIAVGTGPEDLTTYLRQQFAWAYSMFQIFIHHTPRLFRRYSPAVGLQFLVAQSWYALWSVSLAMLWALPSIALLLRQPISRVDLGTFLVYFVPVMLVSSLMWCESRRWFQPQNVKLSWRGVVLETARWPVVLWALVNVLLGIERSYMITPKGVAGQVRRTKLSLYVPYLVLTVVPLAAVWSFYLTSDHGGVRGYFGLALANATVGLIVVATILAMDVRETAAVSRWRTAVRARAGMLVTVSGLAAAITVSAVTVWGPLTRAVS